MGDVAVCGGERALYRGLGRAGKQCDVLSVRREHASIRFDDGVAMLCLARDLHPVPRRPPPML